MKQATKKQISDTVGQLLSDSRGWDYLFNLVIPALERVDDFADESEIADATDNMMIPTYNQWEIMKEFQSPDAADFNAAYEQFYEDIAECFYAIADEIEDDEEEDEEESEEEDE